MLLFGSLYGIAQWYIHLHANEPVVWGATFVPRYASWLGVNPEETMQAMIDDLGIRHFRLVSYWDDIEATPGTYDFSQLDWQFAKAEASGSKVSLSIGLRQPRWPECHMPDWAKAEPKSIWYPKLKSVMAAVIERYKGSPALESYQLENEYFNKVFGICIDFDRDRLVDEYSFVKSLDPDHTLIVSRSNNGVGMPIGEPVPDKYGVSVYKRVWDKNVTKRYFEYPFPAWFYGFLAGGGKIIKNREMIIHELQTEAWPAEKQNIDIRTASIEELYKSLNPQRLRNRFEYGRATGIKEIYLWGSEWWYQMKTLRGAPEIWNTAKEELQKANK
jgi:hypothetical protein